MALRVHMRTWLHARPPQPIPFRPMIKKKNNLLFLRVLQQVEMKQCLSEWALRNTIPFFFVLFCFGALHVYIEVDTGEF